jgi:hypothetical protein
VFDFIKTLKPSARRTGKHRCESPNLESARHELAYDLLYTQQLSLWLDLRILLATAGKVLGIPFRLTGAVLRLPSGSVVEDAETNRDGPTTRY